MRLFSATLATETNTFSPLPTSLDAYREAVFLRPGEHPRRAAHVHGAAVRCPPAGCSGRLHPDRRQLPRRQPRRDHQSAGLRAHAHEILEQLKLALPVDAILLGLHGAMVAYGYDDVEGDIIERARAIAGPRRLIGVELDPHCHMTLRRIRLADIIACYKEYPHTDVVERAEDLLDLVRHAARRDQAGDVAVRLPADQHLPHDLASDVLVFVDRIARRWRGRTVSCRSPSCMAFLTPMYRS